MSFVGASSVGPSLQRRANARNVNTSLLPYGGITDLINSFDYPNLLCFNSPPTQQRHNLVDLDCNLSGDALSIFTAQHKLVVLDCNLSGGALSIFTAQPRAADCVKTFPPPVVPRNFNCTHKFEDVTTEVISSEDNDRKRNALTASDRGEMLGEQPLPLPKKSVFEYISEQDKGRLLSASKDQTVKSSTAAPSHSGSFSAILSGQRCQRSTVWSGHSNFKPFAKDSSKQARYEEYLKTRQGRQSSDMVSDG